VKVGLYWQERTENAERQRERWINLHRADPPAAQSVPDA